MADAVSLFGAARPDGEGAFGLVLPEVGTEAMQVFLDAFAATISEDEHAVMVLDGAGWHGAKALQVPPNVTLVPLPPYSPQLNPMERVWPWLRERFLSLRVFRKRAAGGIGIPGCVVYGTDWQTGLQTSLPTSAELTGSGGGFFGGFGEGPGEQIVDARGGVAAAHA